MSHRRGWPGAIDSDSCSGIKQPAWAFSRLLEPFTGEPFTG